MINKDKHEICVKLIKFIDEEFAKIDESPRFLLKDYEFLEWHPDAIKERQDMIFAMIGQRLQYLLDIDITLAQLKDAHTISHYEKDTKAAMQAITGTITAMANYQRRIWYPTED